MTTVDTRIGSVNDSEYLRSVTDVMGSTIDGELMGDKVTSLKLNIYAQFTDDDFHSLSESNILDVARLIAVCRNLETFDLRLVGEVMGDGEPSEEQPVPVSPLLNGFVEDRCGLLDENGPFQVCHSVLEKVKEFSLAVSMSMDFCTSLFPLMTTGNNPIQLNRLTALRLSNGCVVSPVWA